MLAACTKLVVLAALLAPSARADWLQDLRITISNGGLSAGRFPPFGFACTKKGKYESDCRCWDEKGKGSHSQFSGDPCRFPGGCLADVESKGDDKWFRYATQSRLNTAYGDMLAWGASDTLAKKLKTLGTAASKKFKVATSSYKCTTSKCTVWIGAIRNNQGTIEYGVASATSKVKFKKMYKKKGKCEPQGMPKRWYTSLSRRDLTSAEKAVIKKNMESMAFISAANKAYPLKSEEYRRLYNMTLDVQEAN